MSPEMGAVDVEEVSSPLGFADRAAEFGLRPGFVIDLQGGWNLLLDEHVSEHEGFIESEDSILLMGSPPSDLFSTRPEVQNNRMNLSRKHLEVAVQFTDGRWKGADTSCTSTRS